LDDIDDHWLSHIKAPDRAR